MLNGEKVKVMSLLVALSLVVSLYWVWGLYVILYGSVMMNVVFCLVHAHSAYRDKDSSGYDAIIARVFFASTMYHGVVLFM